MWVFTKKRRLHLRCFRALVLDKGAPGAPLFSARPELVQQPQAACVVRVNGVRGQHGAAMLWRGVRRCNAVRRGCRRVQGSGEKTGREEGAIRGAIPPSRNGMGRASKKFPFSEQCPPAYGLTCAAIFSRRRRSGSSVPSSSARSISSANHRTVDGSTEAVRLLAESDPAIYSDWNTSGTVARFWSKGLGV